MSQALLEAIARFAVPDDEAQLRMLDDAIQSAVRAGGLSSAEYQALLGIFERFPESDGYGVFWAIVHCLEACAGHERLLVESVARAPGEFNVLMINRLLNGGVTQVAGRSLVCVLKAVLDHPGASIPTRQAARSFIESQELAGGGDASKLDRRRDLPS